MRLNSENLSLLEREGIWPGRYRRFQREICCVQCPFYPEDGGMTFLRNVSKYLLYFTTCYQQGASNFHSQRRGYLRYRAAGGILEQCLFRVASTAQKLRARIEPAAGRDKPPWLDSSRVHLSHPPAPGKPSKPYHQPIPLLSLC
jgi:hypothetical protein